MKKLLMTLFVLIVANSLANAAVVPVNTQVQQQVNTLKQTSQAIQKDVKTTADKVKTETKNTVDVTKNQVQQAAQQVYDYNMGMTYEEALKSDKPMVVLFYTNWCGACKRALPTIRAAKDKWSDTFNFVSINAEEEQYKSIAKEQYRLRCYPTVYIVDPKYDNRVHLEVSYVFQLPILEGELTRYQRIRTLLDK